MINYLLLLYLIAWFFYPACAQAKNQVTELNLLTIFDEK